MAEPGEGEEVEPASEALLLMASGDGEEDAEEIVEVVDLEPSGPDDLAGEIEDVDLEEDSAWEEDEGVEEGMEAQDDSEVTFSKHTASVFCVSLDPKTNTLAVTGGEDDRAFVWHVSDGELLFECTGHKDSVTCVGFSYDSTFVATGDMGGLIKVWRVDAKEEIWSFEVGDLEVSLGQNGTPSPMSFWLAQLMATAGCGRSLVENAKPFKGQIVQLHVAMSSVMRKTNTKMLHAGRRAVVGYEDGTVRIWDLKQGNSLHVLKGNEGHQGPLTCVASQKDGSLILTGSVDCHAKLINAATGKVVSVFKAESNPAAEEEAESNSVESLGFCNVMPLAALGYLDGTLAIYDLATQTLRHKCQHESGIVQLLWEESSPVVYTCSLDGALRLWDARSGKLISEYRGHSAEILDFALNKDASLVVTTSGDHQAKVFCVQQPDR
ncbi:hypothetical protein Chor_016089 [Crotalus horridus]